MRKQLERGATLLVLAIVMSGCTSESGTSHVSKPGGESANPGAADTGPDLSVYDTEIPMVKYVWDHQAGDPSVSADLGGPGFTGEGWETNLEFPAIGSADAVKGGSMIRELADWPPTLRMGGQNWNTSFNYTVRDLCFPILVDSHPHTLEFMPIGATHWWIAPDKMTYRFRLNPEMRWSDGSEVTADDYVASWKLWTDDSILDPSSVHTFNKFEPKALSKYIIEIDVKEENWRNFIYAAGMRFLPAKEIKGLTGRDYLDKFQFAYTSFCGPYQVLQEDIDTGNSISLRRNPNWWGKDNPAFTGLYNIDKIQYVVVRDPNLAYEKAKDGEIEYFVIPRAQWYKEDLPTQADAKRGVVVRQKFFNDAPVGTSGIAFNTRRAPLGDLAIRKALAHLFDRETMIDKLFYDEYAPLSSYWQGGIYQNRNNEQVHYDEVLADELLAGAGWVDKDGEGYRVKGGKRLTFEVMYRSKSSEPSLTIYQQSCKKLGVEMKLQMLTPTGFWKNLQAKEYDAAFMNWGALVYPNPETSFHSRLASQIDNNNVTAFADPRVDELCTEYDREYDVKRRIEIIQEIDGIIFKAHPYALGWFNPAQRVVLANKFAQPKWGAARSHDTDEMFYAWWVDPVRDAMLRKARKDASMTMPIPPEENHFWEAWKLARDGASPTPSGQ